LSRKTFWTLIEDAFYDSWLSLNWTLNGNNKRVSAGDGAEGERK
jgi:hypothetical protein